MLDEQAKLLKISVDSFLFSYNKIIIDLIIERCFLNNAVANYLQQP